MKTDAHPAGGGETGHDPAVAGESATDAELVAQAGQGSDSAADRLFRRYRDRAFATALRMCAGNREEALDVTQDAFLAAFRNLKGFKGKSSFYTWFYRILVNTCLDSRRRRGRWKRLFVETVRGRQREKAPVDVDAFPDPEGGGNPLRQVRTRQLQRDVRETLAKMTDQQRMVFILKVFEEMRVPEIAQIMGIAEGTVKSHLFRATRVMRQHLAHWAEPEEG